AAVHGAPESWECGRPFPSPWTSQDIGSVGVAGVSSFSDFGHFHHAGAGGDIWGTADAFQFVWQPLDGDGELVARLGHQMRPDPFPKAGLMLRQALAPHAARARL